VPRYLETRQDMTFAEREEGQVLSTPQDVIEAVKLIADELADFGGDIPYPEFIDRLDHLQIDGEK
jgi:hypothetical protein